MRPGRDPSIASGPMPLRPLPVIPYDYRDTAEALVHKDLRLQFDGNRYCVPHRFVGHRLTVKADSSSVTIYHRFQEIVSYARSWRRGKTFGAERFERELAEQRPAARRSQAQQRFLDFMDGLCAPDVAECYLRGLADSDRVLSRQLNELLELIRQYGPAGALAKAYAAHAFGADYIANILRQQQTPRRPQPPLRLRDPRLNELATDPLSLLASTLSFLNPERNPMTLPEKLDQLSLATMSRQLETTLSEAATKNLSVAATLEWLADVELEARNHRAIERRFKCSRLQAQPSIDGFHFQHQNPHPASTRSGVSAQGNKSCVHRQSPGWAKPFYRKSLAGASARPISRILFTTHGHAESSPRLASRSLVGPQAQDLHRAHGPRRG